MRNNMATRPQLLPNGLLPNEKAALVGVANGYTFEAIGKELGVSGARVRQLAQKAFVKGAIKQNREGQFSYLLPPNEEGTLPERVRMRRREVLKFTGRDKRFPVKK